MHVKKGETCRNFRQQIKMGFVVTSSGELSREVLEGERAGGGVFCTRLCSN